MNEQQIFDAVQNIFRDNFDDDSLVLTRFTRRTISWGRSMNFFQTG